ncbi:tetratricopeptide repeat protein [Paracoccus aminophilus]|uniref:TPR repeat-containing protein n=1 Tax=Paracoccus aminophilus JCM 7686 TaxID=1367847 RepID=S5YT84_PARAH|nr:tetratricopeptide repeat protein [Paracoccus aminophilus]AGT08436.1 TPR repeat-containing protein [Paracoccus aminophilus JCM 7686]
MRLIAFKIHRALTAMTAASLILGFTGTMSLPVHAQGAGGGEGGSQVPALPGLPNGNAPEGNAPDGAAPKGALPDGAAPDASGTASADDVAADPTEPAPTVEDMDQLFAELAEPTGETWRRAESDILRIWSRSGSSSMDLLYKRGEEALDAGDLPAAIGHLTALTDHAPDFAAGWHLRAVAYYLDGEFGPAIADLATTLKLEPRHFGALTQLGSMLEEVGDDQRALEAYRSSLKINPHQQEAVDAVSRIEQKLAGTDA